VVYAKPPFAGPEAVLAYLSRYTHRVAISNRRLIRFDEDGVIFRYKDYRRDMAPNKTDANDADGLAHLAEVGFYREVRVKGYDSMLIRTSVAGRTKLVRITTDLSNQIRGLLKTFGLVVPRGQGSHLREKHLSAPRWRGRASTNYSSNFGGLAQHASKNR